MATITPKIIKGNEKDDNTWRVYYRLTITGSRDI